MNRSADRPAVVVGFDTSNYRTSVAAVRLDGEILVNHRELLPVADGERGLRQSDAVFAHIRQIRNAEQALRTALKDEKIAAVAASTKPRDGEQSYMPVFQVGQTAGSLLAAALDIPFYETTHQRGHLAAALAGTALSGRERMLAVHLSGGTTDLLVLDGETVTQIGGSADLHAGQLVDRAGVAMGLPFPSGDALGAETKVRQWIRDGSLSREDIAREIYDLLARTLLRMLKAGAGKTGITEALVTGGVAASGLLRQTLEDRIARSRGCPQIVFGRPDMSGDNAVGVALIGAERLTHSSFMIHGQ